MNYFKQWKRKFGVVTLFCALMFFSGWMRCQTPDTGPVAGSADLMGMLMLWVLVVPLTATSAYLLISKVRDEQD